MKTKVEWFVYKKHGRFPGKHVDGPLNEAEARRMLKARRQGDPGDEFRLVKTTHEEMEG